MTRDVYEGRELFEGLGALASREHGEMYILAVAENLARCQFADRHYINMTMAVGMIQGYTNTAETVFTGIGYDHGLDEHPCDCDRCRTRAEDRDFAHHLPDWAIRIIRETTGLYPRPRRERPAGTGWTKHWAYCPCKECMSPGHCANDDRCVVGTDYCVCPCLICTDYHTEI